MPGHGPGGYQTHPFWTATINARRSRGARGGPESASSTIKRCLKGSGIRKLDDQDVQNAGVTGLQFDLE